MTKKLLVILMMSFATVAVSGCEGTMLGDSFGDSF